MKLVNKFTLWFIGIMVLITPVSMSISHYNIRKKIDEAEINRLKEVNNWVASQLDQGIPTQKYVQGRLVMLEKINGVLPDSETEVKKETIYNPHLGRNECHLYVNSYHKTAGINYRITSSVIQAEQILGGMMNGVIWKMLLIVLSVALTARIVSRYTLSPFYQTLRSIQHFSLKQQEQIQLPSTNTKEFTELNNFVQRMTDKIREDYASLKEFSENASHELQTPLAVIRSKLDLLANTAIQEDQACLITDMQDAVEKLSKINRSLLLLTKLENHEFDHTAQIRFCKITNQALSLYDELIRLKSITVRKHVDKNVGVKLHPLLAEMLVTNLLSNAIRHNIQDGFIDVELTAEKLVIKNTGNPPEIATDELFKRFKKSNQSTEGIGLGLAIVRQICVLSGFDVIYDYLDDWHQLTIRFNSLAVHIPAAALAES